MGPGVAALAVFALSFLSVTRAGAYRLPSFHSLALASGTDKVTGHKYHHVYERHLPRYRLMPLNFLEIGLGCTMNYGPGKSMALWYQYFIHHNATIDFMEYDGACTEKIKSMSTRGKLLVGDQGNLDHLQRVLDRAQEVQGYDVIIDDGGHLMKQQLQSFEVLWPVVRPGGLYVIEDLQTSYFKDFGGGPRGTNGTTISWIKSVLDALNCRRQSDPPPCITGLLNVDCYEEVCAFSKAPAE